MWSENFLLQLKANSLVLYSLFFHSRNLQNCRSFHFSMTHLKFHYSFCYNFSFSSFIIALAITFLVVGDRRIISIPRCGLPFVRDSPTIFSNISSKQILYRLLQLHAESHHLLFHGEGVQAFRAPDGLPRLGDAQPHPALPRARAPRELRLQDIASRPKVRRQPEGERRCGWGPWLSQSTESRLLHHDITRT